MSAILVLCVSACAEGGDAGDAGAGASTFEPGQTQGEADSGAGESAGPDSSLPDTGSGECVELPDGEPCGLDQICVGQACQDSMCGDGYVHEATGETCDDGNDVSADGCEPETCTYSCTNDSDCADADACNGVESCGDDHRCLAGSPSEALECVCADQPPILKGAEDLTVLANNSPNPGLYDGLYSSIQVNPAVVPWPGNWGESIHLSLTANQYIAAEFNSGSADDSAIFQFAPSGNFEGAPTVGTAISISECPGDFSTHLGQETCLRYGGAIQSMRWATDPSANGEMVCKLDKDHTYFLNIVHSNSDQDGYATTACNFDYCGVLAQQTEARSQ